MGCCSSEETGDLPVLKHRKGVGAGYAFDGAEVDDNEAVFGDEIYVHASDQAKEALREEDEMDEDHSGTGRVMQEFDGGYYKGQWSGSSRSGYGVQVYQDGSIYEGQWKNDKYEGKGRLTSARGDIYTGEFEDGL